MKKNYYLALALMISLASCETEEISTVEGTVDSSAENATGSTTENIIVVEEEIEIEEFEEIQSQFFSEVDDLNLSEIEGLDLEQVDFRDSNETLDKSASTDRHYNRPRITSLCLIKDADRCPFEDKQPVSNMWWPENETDYFVPTAFFSSSRYHRMIFVEFSNGTALIRGITKMNEGKCKVFVNVWLKEKKSWEEWSSNGGEQKKEGCAGDASVEGMLSYYLIDSKRSTLYSWGGDCIAEGCYGLEQRPDPNDPETPNYGAHVGPNGANYDSDLGANGLSTWGWITDRKTGERLWIMDFNFKLRCCRLYK